METTPDGVRAAVAGAARDLQKRGVAVDIARPLLAVMRKAESSPRLRDDLAVVGRLLTELAERIDQAERDEAEQRPFEATWFAVQRRDLAAVDAADRPAVLARMWLAALDAEQLDLCRRIAELAPSAGLPAPVGARLAAVSAALQLHRPVDALPELLGLDILLPAIAVPLLALRARVHMQTTGDLTAARAAAHEAIERAEDGSDAATAAAVLAEVQLAGNDLDNATMTIADALSRPEPIPDVHLIAGMLDQRQARWRRMEDHYDAAAKGSAEYGPRLGGLRPKPANFLWRVARHLRRTDPHRALALIEQALTAGITGKDAYPERRALVDRARLHEQLHRPAAAAADYAVAADRYFWSGTVPRALELYERAVQLDPGKADYKWARAEALRTKVEDDDTVLNTKNGRLALQLLRDGKALRPPEPPDAWVLVSEALLGIVLRHEPERAIELAERALLLDNRAGNLYAGLVAALRHGGHFPDAVAEARQAHESAPDDPAAVNALASALIDIGELSDAAQLLAAHHEPDPELRARTAVVHMLRDDPNAALAAIDPRATSNLALIVRGIAYQLAGRPNTAMAAFETVRAQTGAVDGDVVVNRREAALASLYTGHADDAVRILDDLAELEPRETGYRLDLGLALLAQGNLDRGEFELRGEIDRSRSPVDLMVFQHIDRPMALTLFAEMPHEPAAAALMAKLAKRSEQRLGVLQRGVTRRTDTVGWRAAEARRALASHRYEEAIAMLLDLLDVAPEAEHALRRAVDTLRVRGDEHMSDGAIEAARTAWTTALHGAAADPEAGGRLRARLALARLGAERGDLAAPEPVPSDEAARPVIGQTPLAEALELLVRDVPAAWRYRDRLATLGTTAALGARLPSTAGSLVPFDTAYRVGRRDVTASAVFPMFAAIDVRLPQQWRTVLGSPELKTAVAALRRELAAETGIRIPGVRVRPAPDPGGAELTVAVFGAIVHRQPVPPVEPLEPGLVATALHTVLRQHLHRMIGPDDVDLWLDGWDDPDLPTWTGSPLDPAGRLRLARVLRRLLREGVAVNDRRAIMEGVTAAADADADTAGVLRAVRHRLPPPVLAGGPDRARHPLPADLTSLVGAGLDDAGWELDRAGSVGLLARLREWRAGLPDDAVMIVDDHRLRPVVWRLLAAAGAHAYVMATEEDG